MNPVFIDNNHYSVLSTLRQVMANNVRANYVGERARVRPAVTMYVSESELARPPGTPTRPDPGHAEAPTLPRGEDRGIRPVYFLDSDRLTRGEQSGDAGGLGHERRPLRIRDSLASRQATLRASQESASGGKDLR